MSSTATSSSTTDAAAHDVTSSDSNNNNTLLLIQELRQKVEASLLPTLQTHVEQFSPSDGFDFLHVKNSLLVSYLIDLTVLLRQQQKQQKQQQQQQQKRSSGADNDSDDETQRQHQQNWQRLTEMKVALDKMMRGLDKKLRYQLDKVLQASSSATTFSAADPTMQPNSNPDDPLQYRPRIDDDDDEDDDGEYATRRQQQDLDQAEEDDDDKGDEDLAMAKATVAKARQGRGEAANPKKSFPKKTSGRVDDDDTNGEKQADGLSLYRAPRLASVPYTLDQEDRHVEKEERRKRRLRASEVAQTLRAQYGDAPEQDDVHGGTDFGKQREAARRLAEKEAEKTRYEEEAMVRLTMTRQEKKDRKRVLRQEGSNLAAIADLGNLVRDSRLDHDDHDDDDDRNGRRMDKRNKGKRSQGETERYSNGKRNKRVQQDTMEEGNRFASTKYKGKGVRPKNSLQANLYGGGGGGSGGKSNKQGGNKKRKGNR